MNEELFIILKKLKNSNVDIVEILGCYSILIYSKPIFSSNKELAKFLEEIFETPLPIYITKSRTLMAARMLKIIYSNADNKDIIKNITNRTVNMLNVFVDKIEPSKKSSGSKKRNENENEKMEKWLKGL